MAVVQCSFYSQSLGMQTELSAILPEPDTIHKMQSIPVLYLLHGLSDNHTIWLRRTSIDRYIEGRGLAIIMPQVHRSFYTDMVYGGNYWTFLSKELPHVAETFFKVSDRPEKRFVAGLSMGGYGAMKWALRHPERFAAAASLSGALDMTSGTLQERHPHDFKLIYGDLEQLKNSDNDLLSLLERQKDNPQMPKLYQCCGTEDFLYADNVTFRDQCRKLGYDLTYEEEPGEHTWDYWDMKIQNVLNWLPL